MNYIQSYKNGKAKRKHQIIMEEHIGRELTEDEIVHHIDGNKRNNKIENLLLTTRSEHARIHKSVLDKSIPILQFTLSGRLIKEWKSARKACQELNIQQSNICKCCKGKLKQAGGFIWKYADKK